MENTTDLKPIAHFEFTNQREAIQCARAHGGPIEIDINRVARGCWTVDIYAK